MPNPQYQDLHIDQALTNFSLEYKNDEFVGSKIFPTLPVKKRSDVYFIYGREDFKRYHTQVTPRSKAPEFEYKITKSAPYNLIDYAFSDFIDVETIENADDPLKPELDTTRKVTNVIMLDLEGNQAACALNPSNYASGQLESLSAGDKWSSYNTSNPVMKVDAMRSKIKKNIGGARPNTLLVSEDVHEILKMNPVIRDMVKYTQFGKGDSEVLAKAFEVDNYIVAGGTYNAQKENINEVINNDYLWTNCAILCYVNPSLGLNDLSFGVTFKKNDGRKVLVDNSLNPEGKTIIVKDQFDVKIICPFAGYLLTDVI